MIIRLGLVMTMLSPLAVAMQPLDDEQMAGVIGAGIGFFADDFFYDQGDATASFGGLRDSLNRDLNIELENVYIKGQGSQRGAMDTPAQIGSPLHPFTLNVVTRQQVSTPATTQVMQWITPTYSDPLNDTRQYGIWSLYQGCLYGTAGCTDPTRAVTRIDQELAQLNQTRNQLYNRYNGEFVNLRAGIEIDYALAFQRQAQANAKLTEVQVAIGLFQEREEQLIRAGEVRQSSWNAAPGTHLDGILLVVRPLGGIGSSYYCGPKGYCSNPQAQAYNLSVEAYNTAETARNTAKGVYEGKSDELLTAQRAVGEAWEVRRNGHTLLQRQTDYDSFSSLCGTPTQNQPGCVSGQIGKINSDRDTLMIVVSSLQRGGTRVKGLDIGFKSYFNLPSTAYTQNRDGSISQGATSTRSDFFNIEIEGLTMNNSHLNLWGNTGKLSADLSVQLYAQRMVVGGCRTCPDSNHLIASNLYLDINLGYAELQPLSLASLPSGDIELSLGSVTWANHMDFYRNVPKSNISFGNLKLGNTDIGSQAIRGLRLDHLKLTTVNLPR